MSIQEDSSSSDEDEEIVGDMGFIFVLIDHPMGRKAVYLSFIVAILFLWALTGVEVMAVTLAALFLTALITIFIFTFLLEINVTHLLRNAYYGYEEQSKEKKDL